MSKVTIESEELTEQELTRLIQILVPPWVAVVVTSGRLGCSIFDLDLSIRSVNVLAKHWIRNVGELIPKTEPELLR
jgi:DNA-directed RNA polymerase alpha subunit